MIGKVIHAEDKSHGGGTSLEERVGAFDNLATAVREFPFSDTYTSLKNELVLKATELYKSAPKGAGGDLELNEDRARDFAKELWNFAAMHVAKHYLKLDDKDIELKKKGTDPASGKTQFETFITNILGIDEDALYTQLKTRGRVTAEQINTLVAPIYETHDRVDTSKRTGKDIKDNRDADAALNYVRELRRMYPKALEPLNVPTTYTNIDEVRNLVATAARAIPRDSPINVATTYKKAA